MKVIPLSEGTFTIDRTKRFVPFHEKEHDLQSRPTGSLLVEIQPFLIIHPRDIILLDTGLGFRQDGMLQLHRNLMDAGVGPGEVTKVLLTHLHKDHAGGVGIAGDLDLSSNPVNRTALSFPNAVYYVQRAELDFAFEKGIPSFVPDELECLRRHDQVQLLEGSGSIDGYIHYEVSGGHSPFHQVFRITEKAETVFFGGDEAPQLQQMKHRFIAKYDYDGKRAMMLRQEWWEQGQRDKWTFLFYHDVKNPVWRFT